MVASTTAPASSCVTEKPAQSRPCPAQPAGPLPLFVWPSHWPQSSESVVIMRKQRSTLRPAAATLSRRFDNLIGPVTISGLTCHLCLHSIAFLLRGHTNRQLAKWSPIKLRPRFRRSLNLQLIPRPKSHWADRISVFAISVDCVVPALFSQ